MARLLLIRHAQSTWNAVGRMQGQADPPLDDVGVQQAAQLAERLLDDPPAALYTSPLQRARETAEIIGRKLDISPTADERLKEYDVGDITGLTIEQVAEQYPSLAESWKRGEQLSIPGEEGREPFRARVVAAFDGIYTRHPEGTSAVVAHGGTLGTYLSHLLRLSIPYSPFGFDNGSLTILRVDGVKPRILLLNDTCHLGGEP